MLDLIGFKERKFFYPYPDIHTTQVLYTDEIQPTRSMRDKISIFHEQQTKRLLDEAVLIDHFLDNGVMNTFCNSFFIDLSDEPIDIRYATLSLERPHKHAMVTAIHGSYVTKTAIYPEGVLGLNHLVNNHEAIAKAEIPILPLNWSSDMVSMKYVNAKDGMHHIRQAVAEGKPREFFIRLIHQYMEDMRKCSDVSDRIHPKFLSEKPKEFWGKCRKVVYTEMIPGNSFYIDGRPFYFDQEYSINDCPEVFLLYRIVRDIYQGVQAINDIICFPDMLELLGIDKYWESCRKIEEEFQHYLRQYDKYVGFWHWVFPSYRELFRNRSLVSIKDYVDKEDLFSIKDFQKEVTVVFGTGRMAQRYVDSLSDETDIAYFVDNDSSKWNTSFCGREIHDPRDIMTLPTDKFHVIIAINDYEPILKQLDMYDIGRGCVRVFKG
jgi:hypothetical protein